VSRSPEDINAFEVIMIRLFVEQTRHLGDKFGIKQTTLFEDLVHVAVIYLLPSLPHRSLSSCIINAQELSIIHQHKGIFKHTSRQLVDISHHVDFRHAESNDRKL
jgi:hypothetical protein